MRPERWRGYICPQWLVPPGDEPGGFHLHQPQLVQCMQPSLGVAASDHKEIVLFIQDIRSISDDFEMPCQRNLAANSGMNYNDFLPFLSGVLEKILDQSCALSPEAVSSEDAALLAQSMFDLACIILVLKRMCHQLDGELLHERATKLLKYTEDADVAEAIKLPYDSSTSKCRGTQAGLRLDGLQEQLIVALIPERGHLRLGKGSRSEQPRFIPAAYSGLECTIVQNVKSEVSGLCLETPVWSQVCRLPETLKLQSPGMPRRITTGWTVSWRAQASSRRLTSVSGEPRLAGVLAGACLGL